MRPCGYGLYLDPALDIGGMGLLKLTKRAGLPRESFPVRLGAALVVLMILNVALASAKHTLPMIPDGVFVGIETLLLIARAIVAVLFGHAIHALREEYGESAITMKEASELQERIEALSFELSQARENFQRRLASELATLRESFHQQLSAELSPLHESVEHNQVTLAAYNEDPSKFLGRPKLPKYKHKMEGRNILLYTLQALSKTGLKRGLVQPSMLPIEVQTKQKDIKQVRILPRKGFYMIEVVYGKEVKQAPVNPAWYAGIDIGMNNLVALASNKPAFQAVVVYGRPVKSVNQFYNKRKADLQKQLGHTGTTQRMERMTNKRNRRIDHYMHTASNRHSRCHLKSYPFSLRVGFVVEN